jgi:hypothetical protein
MNEHYFRFEFEFYCMQEEIVAEMQQLADIKRKEFEERRIQESKDKAEAAEKKARKEKAKKNKK